MARTVRISGASPPRRRRSARGRTFSWSAGRSQRPEILDGRLPGFWKTFVQHAEGCDQDMLTREQLLAIFCKTKALQRGLFELSSGLHSGHYFQCAQFLQPPRLAARVCRDLAQRFRGKRPTVVIGPAVDRKSTRLNSSHSQISYAVFFFNDTPPTEISTLSLHDALPIFPGSRPGCAGTWRSDFAGNARRSSSGRRWEASSSRMRWLARWMFARSMPSGSMRRYSFDGASAWARRIGR